MVTRYWQLDAYKLAKEGRGRIFDLSKTFPKEEMYSLTDQIRKSSRSVCSHIAEAWGIIEQISLTNSIWQRVKRLRRKAGSIKHALG